MCDDERVLDELEALKAILMDEITVKTDDRNKPTGVETELFPWTALDTKQQFVRVTLDVDLCEGYPDKPPKISLRNPRGLDDSLLVHINKLIHEKIRESEGQPVIFEIIEIIREHLTASNVPSCECCICLYGFRDNDRFTKTGCYHYFHSYCLAKHLAASEKNFNEEQDKLPLWKRTETFEAVCPVCRAPIEYDIHELSAASPPVDVIETPNSFEPSEELRELQRRMKALYLHQKSRGGIIVEDNQVVVLTDPIDSTQENR